MMPLMDDRLQSDLLWVRWLWSVRIRSEMVIGWVQWYTQTKHERQSRDSDELAIEVTVQAHSCILCHYPEPEDQRKNPPVQKGVRDTTPWSPSLEIWVCLAVASASADLACVVWSAAILMWSFCVHKHYSISPVESKLLTTTYIIHWKYVHSTLAEGTEKGEKDDTHVSLYRMHTIAIHSHKQPATMENHITCRRTCICLHMVHTCTCIRATCVCMCLPT